MNVQQTIGPKTLPNTIPFLLKVYLRGYSTTSQCVVPMLAQSPCSCMHGGTLTLAS